MIESNATNKVNGLTLLSKMPTKSVACVFFDPQYRGVLDKLKYGNEGKSRGKERSALPQMDEDTIIKFIQLIYKCLKPDGYLFLWVDRFELCKGIQRWLHKTSFKIVDLIVWNKERMGMGYRTRHISEYLVVIQKPPCRAKATWKNHSIKDIWDEKITTKNHTHSKPIELQKTLILCVTDEGDTVADFASGGYSVLQACKETNRKFVGGDILFGETWEEWMNIHR